MNDQRELLAHILKHHSSYYELLKVWPSHTSRRAHKQVFRNPGLQQTGKAGLRAFRIMLLLENADERLSSIL
jgi:hypothetical protein